MKRLKQCVVVAVLLGMSTVLVPRAKAQTLDVVFQNTMWGGAIGGIGGFALWALQEKDPVDSVPKYMLRGGAIGIFIGMGFGLYESSQGGSIASGGADVFGQLPTQKGLFHYNSKANQLAIRPDRLLLPALHASVSSGAERQLKLISAEF